MEGSCIIFNYNQKDNCEKLYDSFSKVIDTIIFDCESGSMPDRENIKKLPNVFYGGLYQEMIDYTLKNNLDYVIFVCSDIEISSEDIVKSVEHIELFMDNPNIGIYQISSKEGGHNVWDWCFNSGDKKVRIVPNVEGFMMAIKKDVIIKLSKSGMDFHNWKYGWGIDLITCKTAKDIDLLCVVDDNVMLYHPPVPAGYSAKLANKEMVEVFSDFYSTTYEDIVKYLTKN